MSEWTQLEGEEAGRPFQKEGHDCVSPGPARPGADRVHM